MAVKSAGVVADACTVVSSVYIVNLVCFSMRGKSLVKMEYISGPR